MRTYQQAIGESPTVKTKGLHKTATGGQNMKNS